MKCVLKHNTNCKLRPVMDHGCWVYPINPLCVLGLLHSPSFRRQSADCSEVLLHNNGAHKYFIQYLRPCAEVFQVEGHRDCSVTTPNGVVMTCFASASWMTPRPFDGPRNETGRFSTARSQDGGWDNAGVVSWCGCRF